MLLLSASIKPVKIESMSSTTIVRAIEHDDSIQKWKDAMRLRSPIVRMHPIDKQIRTTETAVKAS